MTTEQSVERERRSTSNLKQRFLAAATLTEALGGTTEVDATIGTTQRDGLQRTYLGCRSSFLGVLAICGLVLVCIAYFLIRPQLQYAHVRQQIDSSIRYLQPSHPEATNQAVWECSRDWIVTAYCNICFSPEHTSIEEMYRLQTDVGKELEGLVDLGTLKRIWARLAKTGPHGRRYIARYEASFMHCFSSDNPTAVVLPASDKSQ